MAGKASLSLGWKIEAVVVGLRQTWRKSARSVGVALYATDCLMRRMA